MNKHDEYVLLFKALKDEKNKRIELIINSLANSYVNQLRNSIVKELCPFIKLMTPSELDAYIEDEFQLDLNAAETKYVYQEINKILISAEFGFKIKEANVGSSELFIEVK